MYNKKTAKYLKKEWLDKKARRCKNCGDGHYAKGLCRRCYTREKRNGTLEYKTHKCKVENCNETTRSDYCAFHKRRFINGLPLNAPKHYDKFGENNPKWNNGTSEYKNHRLMKRQRLIRLKQTKGLCESCGKKAFLIHHIDGSKSNHSLNNLAVLCKKCHYILHRGRKNKVSKFMRLYGMTLDDMAKKYGGSPTRYHKLHKNNKLKELLEEL